MCSSVTIKYSKKADLGPLSLEVILVLRLHDVEDDADSVFVIVSYDALIRICSV